MGNTGILIEFLTYVTNGDGQLHALVALPRRKGSPGPNGQETVWAPQTNMTLWRTEISLAVQPVTPLRELW
jgi:hypothetical protein